MASVRVLGAGASQSVMETLAGMFRVASGHTLTGEFAAVGAIKARVLAGDKADVIVLSDTVLEELGKSGHIDPRTIVPLGRVATGVAVPKDAPLPDVSSPEALRACLLAARAIGFPDPAVATAGKVVVKMLQELGIGEEVEHRLALFQNGHKAMDWLAQCEESPAVGITQVTEILGNGGVQLVAPLPPPLLVETPYAAALADDAPEPEAGAALLSLLAGREARSVLISAGYRITS